VAVEGDALETVQRATSSVRDHAMLGASVVWVGDTDGDVRGVVSPRRVSARLNKLLSFWTAQVRLDLEHEDSSLYTYIRRWVCNDPECIDSQPMPQLPVRGRRPTAPTALLVPPARSLLQHRAC